MNMTEHEIVQSYKEAKFPGKQIEILADLNRCKKEEIMDILRSHGISVNNRVFNGGNHKAIKPNGVKAAPLSNIETPEKAAVIVEEPEPTIQHKQKMVYVPSCVKTMAYDEYELVKLRIGDHERELEKLEKKYIELKTFLKEVGAFKEAEEV